MKNTQNKSRTLIPFIMLLLLVCRLAPLAAQQQPVLVDRIVAVIGGQMVKESEVENNLQQMRGAGVPMDENTRGRVLEELLYQKLLVSQAYRDSLQVSDGEVDQEIDRRMRYYLTQFGSQEAFEQFYGKSLEAFKLELNGKVRELLLAQKMNAKVVGEVSISPVEVKAYYNSLPKDSIPFINAEIEVGQVVAKPKINPQIKEYTRSELERLRQRVIKGEIDFCAACRSYSEDPGSVNNCCTYEGIRRGMFVPEFEAVAFRLKDGEISEVFETEYGYHFIKLIKRSGDELEVAHILRVPPVTNEDLRGAKTRLDSVWNLIAVDTVDFCEAAGKFSDDTETKFNCGLLLNPQTGNSRIETSLLGQIDPTPGFALSLNDMKVGEVSKPVLMASRDGRQAYRLVLLKSRTDAHVANLTQDYQRIQEDATVAKQQKIVTEWVERKLNSTYVHIADDYKTTAFQYPWLKKNK